MYAILKHIHMLALALSFIAFFLRGWLMMQQSTAVNKKIFLIAPHIINALLIGTGIGLAVTLGISPGTQPWLMAKLIALIVYIGLGILTFKHPSLAVRKIFWLAALGVFAYIVSVAATKSPLGFLAGFVS